MLGCMLDRQSLMFKSAGLGDGSAGLHVKAGIGCRNEMRGLWLMLHMLRSGPHCSHAHVQST